MTHARSGIAHAKAIELELQVQGRNGDRPSGFLVAVGPRLADDLEVIRLLTMWRNDNKDAFASRFVATPERTSRWLAASVVGNPNRILFLVLDSDRSPVGHLGIVRGEDRDEDDFELDSVLGGEPGRSPGLMSASVRRVQRWSSEEVGGQRIRLRVLASNKRGVAFYRALGYTVKASVPVSWIKDGDTETLLPCRKELATDEYVTMEYKLVEPNR